MLGELPAPAAINNPTSTPTSTSTPNPHHHHPITNPYCSKLAIRPKSQIVCSRHPPPLSLSPLTPCFPVFAPWASRHYASARSCHHASFGSSSQSARRLVEMQSARAPRANEFCRENWVLRIAVTIRDMTGGITTDI